ncbi:MAG: hypothetical protein VX916_07215 [Planctomycetota bacterium]|nr:hypothetical protein [Planctomycetota bacterium]
MDWKQLGFLTPDAPECQQDLWALLNRLHLSAAEMCEEIAIRTAEPTWAAVFEESVTHFHDLANLLAEEAGPAAQERIEEDELVRELMNVLGEVGTSGHVPSLIATVYAVLVELGRAPVRLFVDVAGPQGSLVANRILDDTSHHPLARVLSATDFSSSDRDNLRRLLRHLHGLLFDVFRSWRQTFHALGIDGEILDDAARETARAAYGELGLKASRTDLSVFST